MAETWTSICQSVGQVAACPASYPGLSRLQAHLLTSAVEHPHIAGPVQQVKHQTVFQVAHWIAS